MRGSSPRSAHSGAETPTFPWVSPHAAASVRATHADLVALLKTTEPIAERLVLLSALPVEEILSAADRVQSTLVAHTDRADAFLRSLRGQRLTGRVPPELLLHEHRIFPDSARQLRWFLDLVLRDDHGGNRQALGQYWKLLCEALAKHLEDEEAYLAASDGRGGPTGG